MFLNCHSWFSLNYGTLSVVDLLKEARRCSVPKLALTDINNTSGMSDFVRLAPSYGVEPVAGIEFRTGAFHHYTGLAKNEEGFRALNEFLTFSLRKGTAEQPEFPDTPPVLKDVFWVIPYSPAMKVSPAAIRNHPDFYLGIRRSQLNRLRFSDWQQVRKKLVAFHPVTFKHAGGFQLHHLLRAVAKNTLLSRLSPDEIAHEDECMLTPGEVQRSFVDFPELIFNAHALLDQCSIDFHFHESKNKSTFSGSTALDLEILRRETYLGLEYRYGEGTDEVRSRVEKELKMIAELGFAAYFLINWDIIRYAQHKNYSYVGRGSGANSIVAYCLRITDVDPIELDLYFERFINPARTSPPDFDIDFSWTDRDDMTEYIFRSYGNDHVALLGAYSTYQSNAVVRELGKVFGLPKGEIDYIVENRRHPDTPDRITKQINYYAMQLQDFPNHLTIHACGIIISEKPISYYTATFMPPKGFPTTQFSMLEAEDLGYCKLDILSQRGLGHIKDTVDIVKENRGEKIDIHDVAAFKKDEVIKSLIRTGRCMGCFYVESPAMRMLLKKLAVDTYIQLVAASSIIRPGVAKSGMMREYILRTHDPARRTYIHPLMKELMEETYGIMVYQEDVIKVAYHFAGLTLSESDSLRRGMSGKFRSRDEFARIQDKYFSNCREKGYPDAISTEVWRQIESFAGYSFSKGHSASYAVESFQSLYLKAHYPKEFMVGVINNFGGFYRTEFYVHEARMSGAKIHAPCINRSYYKTSITGDDIFLGFIHLAGLEKKVSEAFLRERDVNGEFGGLADFMKRVSIEVEQLRILIRIGAFRFTGRSKKQLLWDIHMEIGSERKTEKHYALFETGTKTFTLPELVHHPVDDAHDEIELLGFPLCSPFSLLANESPVKNLAADLPKFIGRRIEIVGYMVTAKYTSTVKREMMMFGTFLDSEGYFFDTTHFPKVADQYPFRGRGLYLIRGKVDVEFGFCSITVDSMEKLSTR
ncbi:MAG: DNA polymerase III subunit alpha [Bacteroidetes bacterium]|nr:DNA polymerase III subunit alpha [Bacteroidota bacterium]